MTDTERTYQITGIYTGQGKPCKVHYTMTRALILRTYCTPAEFELLLDGQEIHPSKACRDWVYHLLPGSIDTGRTRQLDLFGASA